jgi:HAMP domain-containing protein
MCLSRAVHAQSVRDHQSLSLTPRRLGGNLIPYIGPQIVEEILRLLDEKPNRTLQIAEGQAPGMRRKGASHLIRTVKQLFFRLRLYPRSIRWKMLIIFTFFSVFSASLIATFAVAAVNVVVRRECAYLVEEKLNAMVENQRFYKETIGSDRVCLASQSKPLAFGGTLDAVWPGSYTSLLTVPRQHADTLRPTWLNGDSFTGMTVEHGHLAIRSFKEGKEGPCATALLAKTDLNFDTMKALSRGADLEMSDGRPKALRPYREQEGVRGEVAANFIPGSSYAVPVVVSVRNWETGQLEDWVICTVQLSYARTIADLSRMGLQPASWLVPLGSFALAILTMYAGGLLLSARLSQQIVSAIDGLSHAAQRVGKGDFSLQVVVASEQDQLSQLTSSFNTMTRDLQNLRRQEKQAVLLEQDLTLAREIQEHLFPQPCLSESLLQV